MPGADTEYVCNICHPAKGQELRPGMLLPDRNFSKHFIDSHRELVMEWIKEKAQENVNKVFW